ncbi:hypothetical protein EVG20_g11662 [Dentipellis fragilis]|uniref:LysM domain-containing protein n=1 Tax=Dentipellis fragilis TaxID=205917 RepID=A0A4Y9XLI6_9AGAM|nr:hypothetical protein EVG20_g11662 [Dentipellis fragilis]
MQERYDTQIHQAPTYYWAKPIAWMDCCRCQAPPCQGPYTTEGCNEYYTIKSASFIHAQFSILIRFLCVHRPGDTCAVLENQFGLTLDQIRHWNIEIDSNCANLQAGLGYCVSGPPAGTGTLPPSRGCAKYYIVTSGDGCNKIDTQFGITLAQFRSWNPMVNADCNLSSMPVLSLGTNATAGMNILPGTQYCVAGPSSTSPAPPPPSPTALETITPGQGCKRYYTIISGDTCQIIENKFSITSQQFTTWNPEINSQCTNIELGFQVHYCVAGP